MDLYIPSDRYFNYPPTLSSLDISVWGYLLAVSFHMKELDIGNRVSIKDLETAFSKHKQTIQMSLKRLEHAGCITRHGHHKSIKLTDLNKFAKGEYK